ncbi:MAG: DUF1428 domain-containing protein [Flavobacteriaceae bacterium]
MSYVNGFLLAVPTANREKYRALAAKAADVFKKHGALSVVETWGHDVPDGKLTSFPMAVKLKDDETVVFSWIVWPTHEICQTGMKKAMEDFELEMDAKDMPFDGQRMMWGGFETIVDA